MTNFVCHPEELGDEGSQEILRYAQNDNAD